MSLNKPLLIGGKTRLGKSSVILDLMRDIPDLRTRICFVYGESDWLRYLPTTCAKDKGGSRQMDEVFRSFVNGLSLPSGREISRLEESRGETLGVYFTHDNSCWKASIQQNASHRFGTRVRTLAIVIHCLPPNHDGEIPSIHCAAQKFFTEADLNTPDPRIEADASHVGVQYIVDTGEKTQLEFVIQFQQGSPVRMRNRKQMRLSGWNPLPMND